MAVVEPFPFLVYILTALVFSTSGDAVPLITGCFGFCGIDDQSCITECQVCVERNHCRALTNEDCKPCMMEATAMLRKKKLTQKSVDGGVVLDSGGLALVYDNLRARTQIAKVHNVLAHQQLRRAKEYVLDSQRRLERAEHSRKDTARRLKSSKNALEHVVEASNLHGIFLRRLHDYKAAKLSGANEAIVTMVSAADDKEPNQNKEPELKKDEEINRELNHDVHGSATNVRKSVSELKEARLREEFEKQRFAEMKKAYIVALSRTKATDKKYMKLRTEMESLGKKLLPKGAMPEELKPKAPTNLTKANSVASNVNAMAIMLPRKLPATSGFADLRG